MVDALLQIELARAALGDALQAPLERRRAARHCRQPRQGALCARGARGLPPRRPVPRRHRLHRRVRCRPLPEARWHASSWLGNAAAHRLRHLRLAAAGGARPCRRRRPLPARGARDFPHDADWAAMSDEAFRAMVRGVLPRGTTRRSCATCRAACTGTRSRTGTSRSRARAGSRRPGRGSTAAWALAPDKLLAFIEEQERLRRARACPTRA